MNCTEVSDLLDMLMDGELSDEQRGELEAHGRECPACADAIRATLEMKALFADIDTEADVPLAAQAAWRGAVKAEAARRTRRRATRWIATAAAAVVAVVGVGLLLNGAGPARRDAVLMASEPGAASGTPAPTPLLAYAGGNYEPVDDFSMAEGAVIEADGATEEASDALTVEKYDDAAYEEEGESFFEADADFDYEDDEYCDEHYDDYDYDYDEGYEAAEDDSVIFYAPTEDLVCAADAQRAPACELSLCVADVDTACDRVMDLLEEYEGAGDVQRLEDGGANLYAEVPGENVADFLSAVTPMDISGEDLELPELSDSGSIRILLAFANGLEE